MSGVHVEDLLGSIFLIHGVGCRGSEEVGGDQEPLFSKCQPH